MKAFITSRHFSFLAGFFAFCIIFLSVSWLWDELDGEEFVLTEHSGGVVIGFVLTFLLVYARKKKGVGSIEIHKVTKSNG